MNASPEAPDELIPTRHSLLTRLKAWDDHEAWQEFFDTYWRLIYGVARKAGLSDAEAQEVVQETVITVAKNLKKFETDPARGSFKAWLLKTTQWRIGDQVRKRPPEFSASIHRTPENTDRSTRTVERIADPNAREWETVWEEEWQKNLLALALERLKRKVKARHFQIFHTHVIQKKSVAETARMLGVKTAFVYLTKHRVAKQFKEELKRIEREMD